MDEEDLRSFTPSPATRSPENRERIPPARRPINLLASSRALSRELFANRGIPSLCGENSPYRTLTGGSLPLTTIRELRTAWGGSQNEILLRYH